MHFFSFGKEVENAVFETLREQGRCSDMKVDNNRRNLCIQCRGESLVIICGIKKVEEMRITQKTQILFGRICGFTVMFIHRRKTRYTVHTLKWRTLCT